MAAELDYADHAHLTADFRRVLGFSPSQYRQQTISDRGLLATGSRLEPRGTSLVGVTPYQDSTRRGTVGAGQWRAAATPIDCSHAESG
ncbi:helix-turn-helix domain-containing protein [Actinomyces sp. oral taxon 171]|uniref:helix-turn-helix domain-containing protein n=1 Tax=Actinomyces sp. oral taxon 171 TaxID=706438 RepID=UPI001E4ECBFB|nr:helix-turn-helix domain-containing protein [Actinomyces sp. oral taxon 171]